MWRNPCLARPVDTSFYFVCRSFCSHSSTLCIGYHLWKTATHLNLPHQASLQMKLGSAKCWSLLGVFFGTESHQGVFTRAAQLARKQHRQLETGWNKTAFFCLHSCSQRGMCKQALRLHSCFPELQQPGLLLLMQIATIAQEKQWVRRW